MWIYIDHLSLFVVGSSHIFVDYIAVLSKGVKCQIEVLCRGEKFASASVVEIGFQALFDVLCLENLDYLLSFDDVSVWSVHTETVYRLIAVIMGYAERLHKCIVVDIFFGGLNTSGTAVGTMKNTGYPQNQTVKLSAPVLTAAHGFLDLFFDIVIAITRAC